MEVFWQLITRVLNSSSVVYLVCITLVIPTLVFKKSNWIPSFCKMSTMRKTRRTIEIWLTATCMFEKWRIYLSALTVSRLMLLFIHTNMTSSAYIQCMNMGNMMLYFIGRQLKMSVNIYISTIVRLCTMKSNFFRHSSFCGSHSPFLYPCTL